ncbi:MAG: CHAP domain-containing protein [Polyangiaceae bacterium]|nr:CHAP domain-containing protein [Polyangiaceae bacterium]
MNDTMMRHTLRFAVILGLASTVACGAAEDASDEADEGPAVAEGAEETGVASDDLTASPKAESSLKWFASHKGSSSYEHYCEKAVENSYGRSGVYASAIANWNAQGSKRHAGDRKPPRGALVFWRTSVYGHVGVADGAGGFCSTSVGGRIGCAKIPYFQNYLGWAPAPF